MDGIHSLGTVYREETVDALLYSLLCFNEFLGVDISLRLGEFLGKVVSDSHRKHEISVSKTLHKGRSSKAVSAVV